MWFPEGLEDTPFTRQIVSSRITIERIKNVIRANLEYVHGIKKMCNKFCTSKFV